jgi:hypothetical protein
MEKRPHWTVLYNIVSKENDRWVGTGWEFFDEEKDAQAAFDRHTADGSGACKRPYYNSCDENHLGAAHRPLPSPPPPPPKRIIQEDITFGGTESKAKKPITVPECVEMNLGKTGDNDNLFMCPNCNGPHFNISKGGTLVCASVTVPGEFKVGCGWRKNLL